MSYFTKLFFKNKMKRKLYGKIKFITKVTNSFATVFSCFCLALLLNSCAQIVAPNGGKEDRTPPRVVTYMPDSASLNFNSTLVELMFDEFIQLKDLSSQLIVSPPLKYAPEIKAKNNVLLFEFDPKEKLKPNTTYSVYFGNAIQDIHESNAIDNFKYIFSTGTFIDSLMVSGTVQNAFDYKTEKGILVMLYSDFDDSVVFKNTPDYFAKTKDDGSFQINNIKAGKYKLMALKDANANYMYDGDNESIAFSDTLIDVTKNKTVALKLFQEPAKKLFLKTSLYNSFGKITFILNKPNEGIQVKPLNCMLQEKDVFLDYSKNKDTLIYWFRNIDNDSIELEVSHATQVLDTVSFKIIKKEDAFKSNRNPLRFALVNSPKGNQQMDLNATFQLVFASPIDKDLFAKIKNNEIKLIEDSVLYPNYKNLYFEQTALNIIELKLKSTTANTGLIAFKENTPYHLQLLPGTFTDIFGLNNDTINIDFKTREEKEYGSIKLKIDIAETTTGNYIVQLLDEKENILRANNIKKPETIMYQYILPKKYKLKIIVDENTNYTWDTGNLIKKLQAEKVIYNAEAINTRASWDFDLEWKIITP
jgi:hypothetical protein